MQVHMIAIDPESETDAVPFASEEDAKRYCEEYFRDYIEDEAKQVSKQDVSAITFEWRSEEPPWQDIFVLYANGRRQPCLMWEAQVLTYLTAKRQQDEQK